jgi:hypothetical protein
MARNDYVPAPARHLALFHSDKQGEPLGIRPITGTLPDRCLVLYSQ